MGKRGAKMEKMHTNELLALVAGRRGITFTLLVIHACIMYVNDTAETHACGYDKAGFHRSRQPPKHACM